MSRAGGAREDRWIIRFGDVALDTAASQRVRRSGAWSHPALAWMAALTGASCLLGDASLGVLLAASSALVAVALHGRGAADRAAEAAVESANPERLVPETATGATALQARQAALQDLVYTVAHGIKNPLNGIVLLTDLVLTENAAALSSDARARLERILRVAEDTEDMVRDLLAFVRVGVGAREGGPVDLAALTQRTLETLSPQIGARGARLEVGQLPVVWGDEGQLGHLMANLVGNALKYVPRGRGEIRIHALAEGAAGVLVVVSDNGIGIPSQYHRRIFDLFGRVPAPEQIVDGTPVTGSGVGLAMVQRIAEAHGGTVHVESAPGRGSTFSVRLAAEAAA